MSTELPRLRRHGNGWELVVDGEPFLLLGAQVHNSSASPSELPSVWQQALALGVSTVEVPIYWSELEPREGSFDTTQLDAVVRGAREHGLRLVLLWFGTWKNGTMDYVPSWVKGDAERFPRMLSESGKPVRALSPHARGSLEADRRALEHLVNRVQTLEEESGGAPTVLLLQIQNEPGSLFVDRDYGAVAEELFHSDVPGALVEALGVEPGPWPEVFGARAAELFNGCATARYVDELAVAAKAVRPLPVVVNAWLKERKSWQRPGEQYPSGGPTSDLVDLWKVAAPNVDVLAPDIYVRDSEGFREVCAAYSRDDNPLFVPETFSGIEGARYLFYAVGDYDCIGYAPFGFNRLDGEEGLLEVHNEMAKSFRLLGQAAPLILELRRSAAGTSRPIQSAVEEPLLGNRLLHFDGWDVLVQFGGVRSGYGGDRETGTRECTGRALVLQTQPNELFVLGVDARVSFRSNAGRRAEVVRVEEGAFEGGVWTPQRPLNGDQIFFGLRLLGRGTTLRVELQAPS